MIIDGPEEGYQVSTHDNIVEFIGVNVYFWWQSWSITDGQPIESAYSTGGSVDVVAGRKSSVKPAAVYTMGLAVTNLLGLNSPLSTAPAELNFVVMGEMTFFMPDGSQIQCPDWRMG